MKKYMMALIAVFMIAGCNSSHLSNPPPSAALQPPQWGEGYRSGCNSGYVAAGHPYFSYEKDVVRYQKDAIYKDGWDSGYDVCKTDYSNIRSR